MATDFDGYVAGPGDPPEFADYEQYVLQEYNLYRVQRLLTPLSFEVRQKLAKLADERISREQLHSLTQLQESVIERDRSRSSRQRPGDGVLPSVGSAAPHTRARPLDQPELLRLVADVAARPELWNEDIGV